MAGVLAETTFFAFCDEQFNEIMKKFCLNPKDKNQLKKIIKIPASGFYLKERLDNLRNVINQNFDEMRITMQDEQFAYQMFISELCNHKHFFSNQFRPFHKWCQCHRSDFKAPYSAFLCQATS